MNQELRIKKNHNPVIHNSLFILHASRQKGFGLLEIIIASAILSASLISLTATSQISFRLIQESLERAQASLLSEEGIEVVRFLRDESYSGNIAPLAEGVDYRLSFAASTSLWSMTTTTPARIYGIFERTLSFEDVYRRNSDSDIVPENSLEPKTLDPDTKKASARVEWEVKNGITRDVILETYISNVFQN